MTFPELDIALDGDMEKRRPPFGEPAMSHDEVLAGIDRWRRMTPQEKLLHLRKKYRW